MARLAPAAGAGVDPLTAAAPDMLASLRALLPHAKGQSFAFRALAIEAAEAAIAKAEGR